MADRSVTASLHPIRDDLMEDEQSPPPAVRGDEHSDDPGGELTWQVQAAPTHGAADALPAAWAYDSRRRKESVAWTLWTGAAMTLLWFPALDAYLRSFGSLAVKLVIWLGGAVSVAVAVLAAPPVGLRDQWLWGTTIGAVITGSACLLVLILWWLVDGLRMRSRLEHLDEQTRREVMHDYGIDPREVVAPAL